MLFAISSPGLAASAPQALSLGGQLFTAAGLPITNSSVNFRIQVYDATETCILYSEEHLGEDLSAAQGHFNLILGSGTSKTNNVGTAGALDGKVFANAGSTVVAGCAASPLTLSAGQQRQIHVLYDLGSGYVTMTPAVPVVAAAYAMVADSLNGLNETNFIQVNGTSALSQANEEYAFSLTNWPRLKALLDGTSSQYLTQGSTTPYDMNGQRVTDVHDPTAAQDAATKHYVDTNLGGSALDLTAVGPMTGAGSTLLWDATANKWVAGTLSTSPTGTAGGDLTGTYPNPTIANDKITSAKISSTGIAVNRLIITDATTGANLGYGACTVNGQVYAWTATGWQCTNVSTLAPVTSVAGKTGVVTLNAADISGLGTAALFDWGTAANQIVRLDGTARLPAVDGSQLVNVNAVQLQGRGVASLAPTLGQVLGWNGTAWTPVGAAAGSVTAIASGTGLVGGPITSSGTLAVDTGTTANKILQLNASAQIPAVDGSLLTSINAVTLQSRVVATTAPAGGQVLGWNSTTTQWEPMSAAVGSVTSIATSNGILGGPITSSGTLSIDTGTAANKILQLNASAQVPAVDGSLLTQVNAVRLQTRAVAATAPTAGQTLAWNAATTQWEPFSSTTGTVTNISSGTGLLGGPITATGTLSVDVGTAANKILQLNASAQVPAVDGSLLTGVNAVRLQTRAVAATAPVGGQVLGWNSGTTQWEPMSAAVGSVTSITTANGILGGPITSSGTLSIDTGTSANKILQLNASAQVPAVDGSLLTGVNAVALQTRAVSAAAPTAGQVLGWNAAATRWEPTTGAAGSVTNIASGTGLLGGPITNTGTLSVNVGTAPLQIVQENANAQIAQSAGSAAQPSFSFNGNVSSGLYSPGANQVALSTNGTAALTISAAGNVGIGTTVPVYPLMISPTAFGASLALQANGHDNYLSFVPPAGYSPTTPRFDFGTLNATSDTLAIQYGNGSYGTAFAVNGYGLVGIGTMSPQAALDVVGTGSSSALIVPRDTTGNRPGGVNGMIRYNTSNNGLEGFVNGSWSAIAAGSAAGTITNIATGAGLLGGPIMTSGTLSVNVGTAPLQVVQENAAAQIAQSAGTSAAPSYTFAGNTNTGLYSPGTNQLALSTNGTAALTILANGNVGLGSTAPTSTLDIYGQSQLRMNGRNILYVQGDTNITDAYVLSVVDNNSTSDDRYSFIVYSGAGTTKNFYVAPSGRAYFNGKVGIGTTAPAGGLDVVGLGTAASSLLVPRDTTTNRPAGVNGMIRYNTTAAKFEAFENGSWVNVTASGAGSGDFKADGSVPMTGAFRAASGSSTAPSVTFAAAGTTGFFSYATNVVAFTSGGATMAYLGNNAISGNANYTPFINFGASSLGNPTYSAVGATSNGLHFPGGGNLELVTNGVSRLHADPNGLVGVGTTVPQAALDIVSLGTTSALILPRDTTGNRPAGVNGMIRYNTSNNGLEGFVNGLWSPLATGTAAGTVTNIVSGVGLVGGPITTSGTLAVDVGTAANKVLQLNASAQVPAVDGSLLTNVNAVSLQTRSVASTAPTAGQVLGWNSTSSQWQPTSLAAGGVTSIAAGTGLLGGPITTTGTLSVNVGTAANQIVQENANAQVAQSLGTAALPSYSFVGNSNTGFFSPGAGQLSLAANGTAALSVLANGNVGIGTTAPATNLHVFGGALIGANDGSGANVLLNAVPTNNGPTIMIAYNNGSPSSASTDYALIQAQKRGSYNTNIALQPSGGGVGIGTVSPAAALDVVASNAIIVPRDTTANRPGGVNGMIRYNTSNNAMEGFVNGSWANFATGAGVGTVTNIASGTGLLGGPITSTGTLSVNVGTAPTQIVQENANAQVAQSFGSAALPAFSFGGNTTTGLYSPAVNQLALATNGTASFFMDAAGNVALGNATASPITSQLTVGYGGAGSSPRQSIQILENGIGTPTADGTYGAGDKFITWNIANQVKNAIGGDSYGQWMQSSGNANAHLSFYTGATAGAVPSERLRITSSGSVGIGLSTPQAALDVAVLGTTSAIIVPRDTTANRPGGVNGMIRYNTSNNAMEGFVNGSWANFATGAGGGVSSIAAGTGLLGGPITSTGTLSVNVGTAANQIVQENATAQIAQASGSLANPSYAFAGSLGTGVYSPGANQLALVANGTAALNIAASGFVGLGTSNPTAALHVTRAVAANPVASVIENTATGASASAAQYVNSANGNAFLALNAGQTWTAGVDRSDSSKFKISAPTSGSPGPGNGDLLTVTTGGSVGIGTTSPGTSLEVNGMNVAGPGAVLRVTATGGDPGNGPFSLVLGDNTQDAASYRGFRMGITSSGDGFLNSYVAGTNRNVLINPYGGNLGVGTYTPQAALDVYAQGASSAVIIPRDNTGNRPTGVNGMIRYNTDSNSFEGFNGSWGSLGGSGPWTVNSPNIYYQGGNVGIGTTSMDHLLDVWGTNTGNNLAAFTDTTATAQDVGATIQLKGLDGSSDRTFAMIKGGKQNGTSGNYDGYFAVMTRSYADNGLAEKMRVTAQGLVGIGTTTPASTLDVNGNAHVNGQVFSKSQTITGGTASIDFNNGNSISTDYGCASNLSFANLRDGGTYTLVVTNTGTTQCNFGTSTTGGDAATVSYRFKPLNSARTASSHTIYTLMRVGTIVYVSWSSGF